MFVRILVLAALSVVLWSFVARPTVAHGPRTVYRVQAYDTLWSIASSHYGGDVRDAVWRIQRANHLGGPTIQPGETLVLP